MIITFVKYQQQQQLQQQKKFIKRRGWSTNIEVVYTKCSRCQVSKFERWKYYCAGFLCFFSLLFFFAFFLCIIIVIIISLTTGLSRVTILANASCTVSSNVYDADFVLATIWLISFAYALIVNNSSDINISESNKIYNDDDNISMMPTIILVMMMMSLLLLTIVYRSRGG